MEETLGQGLARLFGGAVDVETPAAAVAATPVAGAAAAAPGVRLADLVREATQRYEDALAAQRVGDWARYGEQMRLVGELLQRMRELAGRAP